MRIPFPNANRWLLLIGLLLTIVIYAPGLSGAYLFDDFPNIVENKGVQPADASLGSLARAALSSPSSEFKRPLASLSFAANYLATGLDPYWMKLTNLLIHLINGALVYWLTCAILQALRRRSTPTAEASRDDRVIAAWIAFAWLVLPINLTSVLYVVQRMEAMAATFIFLGLLGYIAGRRRMLAAERGGALLCLASVIACTGAGLLAKETAVMLPLYALLVEWLVFGFRKADSRPDAGIIGLFVITLLAPLAVGLAWQLPGLLNPGHWANRNFTLGTRLMTEARVIVDYIGWTVTPTPSALSFYHDDFKVSQGLLTPWTTLASIIVLAALAVACVAMRKRFTAAALGIAFFLGCQLLTGTILPLELVYEHRNYFASYGLMLALIPLLASGMGEASETDNSGRLQLAPRNLLLGVLLIYWCGLTAFTAHAWGEPLRLAMDLAARAPNSPRAQYELGRTYILLSKYNPESPFTKAAYAPLERSAALPDSSILPEQALIFMNSRMGLPLKEEWWESMVSKLKVRKPSVQDESSLEALAQCAREKRCDIPDQNLTEAFFAALSHNPPSSRLLAVYGSYAWNVLGDQELGARMLEDAVKRAPNEPAYRITLARMLNAQGRVHEARQQIAQLNKLNFGGRLDADITELTHQADANAK